jgi:hypothetical protein
MRHVIGRRLTSALLAIGLLACAATADAQVFAIEPIEKGLFISGAPSLTLYWPGTHAKALLLFIPGGEGHIRLTPGQTDHRYQFHQMLKRLTDTRFTRGQFDVVLLDSPSPLSPNQRYPVARGSRDHLVRIESAVRFYKDKTGLPVWLMGHSNGSISLMEFVRYMKDKGAASQIAGVIASGARNETSFEAPIEHPVLFMHHRQDACASTRFELAQRLHAKLNEMPGVVTEFHALTTGAAEAADPCYSGYHMYFGASEEAASVIDAFVSKAAAVQSPAPR